MATEEKGPAGQTRDVKLLYPIGGQLGNFNEDPAAYRPTETIRRAQERMKASGIDCWLTLTAERRDINSLILTGQNPSSYHAIIVPKEGKPTIIIPEMEGKTIPREEFTVVYPAKKEGMPFKDVVRSHLAGHGTIAMNYADEVIENYDFVFSLVGHSEVLEVKSMVPAAKIVPSRGIQYSLRSVKGEEELKLHEKAVEITEAVAELVLPKLEGMTEQEVAALINYEMEKRGAGTAFETIVASGPNSANPHHNPTDRRIAKEDVVILDFGAKYRGKCADLTYTVSIGPASEKVKEAYSLVRKAQHAVIGRTSAGVPGGEIEPAANEVLKKYEQNVGHTALNHHLGVEDHDVGPDLFSKDTKDALQERNLIAIEPGLYFNGEFGIRLETNVVVTKSGCRRLTKESPEQIREI